MRSRDEKSDSLFSYADGGAGGSGLEARVPQDIPLRAIREQKHDMLIVIDDRLRVPQDLTLYARATREQKLPGHGSSSVSLARHGAIGLESVLYTKRIAMYHDPLSDLRHSTMSSLSRLGA